MRYIDLINMNQVARIQLEILEVICALEGFEGAEQELNARLLDVNEVCSILIEKSFIISTLGLSI